jgi:hypothetical protein
MTMKAFRKMAAQGDVILRVVDRIPSDAKPVERKSGAPLIVTHSETGHHHVVRDAGVSMFEDPGNPLIAYLRLDAGAEMHVEHLRPHDTHETLGFVAPAGGACIQIIRQQEYTPEGWRRVQD